MAREPNHVKLEQAADGKWWWTAYTMFGGPVAKSAKGYDSARTCAQMAGRYAPVVKDEHSRLETWPLDYPNGEEIE